jgi:hypothetical protein
MNLKSLFIAILISGSFSACTSKEKQRSEAFLLDSIRKADSISVVYEQQRLIDSINMVTREQQIIADSINNLVLNDSL